MLHDQFRISFVQQARALCGQLDRAATWCAAEGVSEADLLGASLAPDMFPLAKQLDFVVAQVLLPLRRLTGQDIADPAEAAGGLAAYRDRLAAAVAIVEQIDSAELDAAAGQAVAFDLPNGMAFDLSGADYVRDWAVPQFFFHVMTAYAIMRMRGVPLGKADFVPYMAKHARRTTG
jgi:uncharacterized protein